MRHPIVPVLTLLLALLSPAARAAAAPSAPPPPSAAAAPISHDLAAWAPAEALAFVQAADWSALDSVLKSQELPTKFNIPLDTMRAVFPGPVGFFVNNWRIPDNRNIKDMEEWAEKAKWEVCFIGRHSGDARQAQELLMKALGPLPADAKQTQTSVAGAPVFTISYMKRSRVAVPDKNNRAAAARSAGPLIREDPVVYQFAFPQGMTIFSIGGGDSTQRSMLAASNGPSASLVGSPVYQSAMYGLAGGSLSAYINVNAFYTRVEDYLEESLGANPRGLGLHTLFCGGLTVRAIQGGSQLNVNLVSSSKPQGALAALLPPGEPRLDLAQFAPADSISLATARLDFAALWQTIETVIKAEEPAVKVIVDAQLALIREEKGIDLIPDVIGSLTGDMLYYTKQSTPQNPRGDETLILWLKPGKNPEEALSFGLAYLGQFLNFRLGRFQETVEGARIWASGPEETGGVDPFPFAFAVKGDRLIIAREPADVAEALRLKVPSEAIYQNPYFKVANPWVPQPRQIFGFSAPGSTVMNWAEIGRRWLHKSSMSLPALGDFVDLRRIAGLRKDLRDGKIFAGATRPAQNILQLQMAIVE